MEQRRNDKQIVADTFKGFGAWPDADDAAAPPYTPAFIPRPPDITRARVICKGKPDCFSLVGVPFTTALTFNGKEIAYTGSQVAIDSKAGTVDVALHSSELLARIRQAELVTESTEKQKDLKLQQYLASFVPDAAAVKELVQERKHDKEIMPKPSRDEWEEWGLGPAAITIQCIGKNALPLYTLQLHVNADNAYAMEEEDDG